MIADYVVVGSGSAGAALVDRLSEDGRHSVLVIEAGGSDVRLSIDMPAALSELAAIDELDWGYVTEPEPHLDGRSQRAVRGRVLGGSSSINGMCYVRGHPKDFDRWAEMGAHGWAFADVLPYFKRLEAVTGGDSGWRGADGPLRITRPSSRNPLFKAFIAAGHSAGFETTEDYNGRKQEGFALMEQNIYRGKRWSTSRAYLDPALKRPNVSLLNGVAKRVAISEGRATGVEAAMDGRSVVVEARREVVLAASAFNSPKLLMLSGIGPADHLREFGIEVVANRPGVGANLQDHPTISVQHECLQPITLHRYAKPLHRARLGLQWLLFKSGPGATNHVEACAFVRSKAGEEYPDIQFHFIPAAATYGSGLADFSHGFQVNVGPMRSRSRGRVELRSADYRDAPKILYNYLSHDDDWRLFRHCVRVSREILRQGPLDPYRGREISPGPNVQTDSEIDDFVRRTLFSTMHPCGTVRMGAVNDPSAVVDPATRVIGVDRLRVVDSSIMPRITTGNLNGPTVMLAEKAADHILGEPSLPRSNQTSWVNPRWQTSDR